MSFFAEHGGRDIFLIPSRYGDYDLSGNILVAEAIGGF